MSTLIGLLVATSAFGNPGAGVKAETTGFGILKSLTPETVSQTPETTSGVTRDAKVIGVVGQTNRIPATLGVRFGFAYFVQGLPSTSKVVLKKIVKHPTIRKPDGTTSEGFVFLEHHTTSPQGTIKDYTGYGFDHSCELATGQWVIEMWYGEQKLIEQTFQVFKPGEEPSDRDRVPRSEAPFAAVHP